MESGHGNLTPYGIIALFSAPALINSMRFFRYHLQLLLATGLASSLIASEARADPPAGYEFETYDRGIDRAGASNKKVFVYFGREGCGYCEVTNKKAFSAASVRNRYQGNYELVYVDAESGKRLTLPSGERITERDLGARFKAFVTPVFVFLEPDGRQIFKRVGIQTEEQLLAYDDFVQQEHYRQQTFEQYEKSGN